MLLLPIQLLTFLYCHFLFTFFSHLFSFCLCSLNVLKVKRNEVISSVLHLLASAFIAIDTFTVTWSYVVSATVDLDALLMTVACFIKHFGLNALERRRKTQNFVVSTKFTECFHFFLLFLFQFFREKKYNLPCIASWVGISCFFVF